MVQVVSLAQRDLADFSPGKPFDLRGKGAKDLFPVDRRLE